MLESSLEYLRCARCASGLRLRPLRTVGNEIEEGFLECGRCGLLFPVIGRIPILWDDFSGYVASRRIQGGRLYRMAKSPELKGFVRSSLPAAGRPRRPAPAALRPPPRHAPAPAGGGRDAADRTPAEDRWSRIYLDSRGSEFYSAVRDVLGSLPRPGAALDCGCSVGLATLPLADSCGAAFGTDLSFGALRKAKMRSSGPDGRGCGNLDYVLADALSPVFGAARFGLVLALNVLEVMEPAELLGHVSGLIPRGHLVVSDPYDFDRGARTVRNPLDESSLRSCLRGLGFRILPVTEAPSYIPWDLRINARTTLHYKVDLVVGERRAAGA